MKSQTTRSFRKDFRSLPPEVRQRAARAYELWKQNPQLPGLNFKRVNEAQPYYSVRIGRDYRAVGQLIGNTVYWEFIGPHDDYMSYLKGL